MAFSSPEQLLVSIHDAHMCVGGCLEICWREERAYWSKWSVLFAAEPKSIFYLTEMQNMLPSWIEGLLLWITWAWAPEDEVGAASVGWLCPRRRVKNWTAACRKLPCILGPDPGQRCCKLTARPGRWRVRPRRCRASELRGAASWGLAESLVVFKCIFKVWSSIFMITKCICWFEYRTFLKKKNMRTT